MENLVANLNELTSETILSDEVFEAVFDSGDLINRTRTLMKLTDRATELGVKTKFEKLVRAYEKTLKEYEKNKSKQETSNVTDFRDLKYDNMYCGSWIANDKGIKTYSPITGEVFACYHPIMPVQILVNAETNKEKIKLAYKKKQTWREIIVDKGVVASANKIVGLAEYGVSVTSENAKYLVRFLNDIENLNTDKIQEQISTSKLGWVKDEFMPYSDEILFDNESRFKDAYDSIKQQGSSDEWYSIARQIRRSQRFEPKIYLAGALASVLLEPLNALPFIINIWGDTGKGKTVAIMLAASVWAYPCGNEYITDPKSTVTALELRLDFLNHLPMLIDDIAQVKEKYGGEFAELVYMLCSGKGKDRSNVSLGLNKSTTWKNIIMTNGEHSIVTETMQGGAVNRVIDVEMEEGYIFEDGNKTVEILKQNYGFAGKEFVDLIQEIGFEDIKDIQQDYLQKIKRAAEEKGIEKEEKQMLPMSILLTADKLATEYLFKDDCYMDFDKCVELLKDKNEVSENERAYDFILSDIAININKFVYDEDYRGEIWGDKDGDFTYIITSKFDDMCKRGNFSRKSFISWAKKKDLIQVDKGRNTKSRRIKGQMCKCICIYTGEENQLKEFVQLDMFPELAKSLPFG